MCPLQLNEIFYSFFRRALATVSAPYLQSISSNVLSKLLVLIALILNYKIPELYFGALAALNDDIKEILLDHLERHYI